MISGYVTGQSGRENISATLAGMFGRANAAREDSVKLGINDSIVAIIDGYARSDSVFDRGIKGVKYLGQISSPDSKLKILTWNLMLNDSAGRYYCYFIHRSGKVNSVRELTTDYHADPVRTDIEYNEDNWYGALYYDVRPVKAGDRTVYMLLGIDYGNPSVTRKVIDVLNFTPDGNITFGRKWFVSGNEVKYREVLEYSSTAIASLKFLSDKVIVFDHLVPFEPRYSGKKEFYGPDFSYDSYRFEKGLWRLTVNIDVRNRK